jgi:hypothetical protein
MTNQSTCMSCPEELLAVDEDANGTKNSTCRRCRAEEDHDFDAEPNAVFNRMGERVTDLPKPKKRFVVLDRGEPCTDLIVLPDSQLMEVIAIMEALGRKDCAEAFKSLMKWGRDNMAELE